MREWLIDDGFGFVFGFGFGFSFDIFFVFGFGFGFGIFFVFGFDLGAKFMDVLLEDVAFFGFPHQINNVGFLFGFSFSIFTHLKKKRAWIYGYPSHVQFGRGSDANIAPIQTDELTKNAT